MRVDEAEQRLVCPACRGRLAFYGSRRGDQLWQGRLECGRCARAWSVSDGLPRLLDEAAVGGVDRLMRLLYDHLAVLHDPAVRFLLPVLQSSSADDLRNAYMPRLELDRLGRERRRPPRILEVGVGTGANLPLLARDLPPRLDVELWGCDLSEGMLAQCQQRLSRSRGPRMRLVVADAHALPFPDSSFDRVFHVGGIAGYRDPARGLAEMARVARPGTPIVVVDEQLDPQRAHGLYHRLIFRALTFYTPDAVCPTADLPTGATDVLEEQVSRFYYCLRFRMRRARSGAAHPSGEPRLGIPRAVPRRRPAAVRSARRSGPPSTR